MSDIERIRAEVQRVREEHCKYPRADLFPFPSNPVCAGCSGVGYLGADWPCPTLRLAEKYLKLAEALVAAMQFLPVDVHRGPYSPGWANTVDLAERALAECAGDDATSHEPDPDAGILGHSPEAWERSTRRGEKE